MILPYILEYVNPVWHLYVVRTETRDKLKQYLTDNQIETLIHYPIPPHLQKAYANLGCNNLPIAEILADQILSLPMGPHISEAQIETVIDIVKRFFEHGL